MDPEQFANAVSEMRFRSDFLDIYNQMMQQQQQQQEEQKPQEVNGAPAAAASGSEVETEAILTQLPPPPVPVPAPVPSCGDLKTLIAPYVTTIKEVLTSLPVGPLKPVFEAIAKILNLIANNTAGAIGIPVRFALSIFKTIITQLSVVTGLDVLLVPLQGLVQIITGCNLGLAGSENGGAPMMDVSSCSTIADMYRLTVAE
ncbi:hypothetical protein BG004_003069, partial [Podila humilis]